MTHLFQEEVPGCGPPRESPSSLLVHSLYLDHSISVEGKAGIFFSSWAMFSGESPKTNAARPIYTSYFLLRSQSPYFGVHIRLFDLGEIGTGA